MTFARRLFTAFTLTALAGTAGAGDLDMAHALTAPKFLVNIE